MVVRELLTRYGFQFDDNKVSAFQNRISTLGKAITGLVSIYLVKQLGQFVKSASDYTDEIAKGAQSVGMTTDAFQQLGYAFTINGVTMQDYMMSFRKMVMLVGNAQQGTESAVKTFGELGMGMDEVNALSKDSTKLFMAIVDRIKAIENPTKRAQMMFEFLGRSGARMAPAINQGSDAIKALMERATKLGVVIEADLIKKGEKFHDKWEEITMVLKVAKTKIALELMPAFEKLFNVIMKIPFYQIFKNVKDDINMIIDAMGGWKKVLTAISILIGALFWKWVLIAGIFLIIDDILGALQGKQSVFEDLFGKGAVENLKIFIEAIKPLAKILSNLVQTMFLLASISPLRRLLFGAKKPEEIAETFKAIWGIGRTPMTPEKAPPKVPITTTGKGVTINQTNNIKSTDPKQAATEVSEITKDIWEQFSYEIQ